MYPIKKLALAGMSVLLMGALPLAGATAADEVAQQLAAARQEGAIRTVFALNRHLNPFRLRAAVVEGRATVRGQVESEVQRDLAEQLALSIEGVEAVDNRVEVDAATAEGEPPPLVRRLQDANLAATVRSRLQWNSNTRGLDIQVKSEDAAVTLSGHAQTPAAKELAGQLAGNTDGVREVFNHLSISTADSSTSELQVAAEEARESISDGWITSKVESSFAFSRNLDALNISVSTDDGFVSLRGSVLSAAERRLAVDIARNIRGVRGVDADALRIDS